MPSENAENIELEIDFSQEARRACIFGNAAFELLAF
jgi:hypothetical protein